ncbi:hypothetical protein GCM10018793_35210 [Streptomyces sulfonofaciens]|uniref:Type VII secretion system-associated protein n=1 Tax=Streptomyces sulfonofaciens TaxID=68272 RepID=A0A919GA00_9ACTN|nr:type VII secretion system-associated protein [Streptomyces sulfonofaciens]GHH80313.1 hypothetical protein GCM10018793_35210 [Streptomyces sulfonofaciens]
MADLTHLDSHAITQFKQNDLADFLRDLDAIRNDDPAGVKSLKSVLAGLLVTGSTFGEVSSPLVIGLMAGDDTVSGQSLNSKTKDAAQGVDDILVSQKTLFKDIDEDLQETIDTLLKDQSGGLAAIDGAKLLDIFSDVDGDLTDGSGSSTGTTK